MRESGAGFLLLALCMVSAGLMTVEATTRLLETTRSLLGTVLSPITFVAEAPYLLSSELGEVVASRDTLQTRNADLQQKVLELSQVSQQYRALRTENQRLRELLGSRAGLPQEVLIAELIGVIPTANTHQVKLDKGTDAGVRKGHAVIDAFGLFGQVTEVNAYTSTVLLVADADHAVPVEVDRNGVRSIAGGTGYLDRLELEFVPVTADIVVGDLLVTSGLGGVFPRGYPVGTVESVVVEATDQYAKVVVRPSAALDRTRHVLIVFSANADVEELATTAGADTDEEAAAAVDGEEEAP